MRYVIIKPSCCYKLDYWVMSIERSTLIKNELMATALHTKRVA